MSNEVNTDNADSLRYLDANAVECPVGKLEGLSLFTQDDEPIGRINGVLIDPAKRQIRYYVVDGSRLFYRRRYLVPADSPAVVVPEHNALRMEVPSDSVERHRFDARAVQRFSDDDLLTAMFASQTA
ncbi:MAG: PRC-barrel domain-containing protein [Vicinamibacterales bacterium]